MKLLTVIFDTAATIIIIAVAIIFAPYVAGMKPYIVLSGSMEPGIHTGSLAYVNTRTKISSIKPGDVITYEIGGNAVTHRVVSMKDDEVFTKGDANESSDLEIVKNEKVIGKTIYTIPYLGYIVSYLQSPYVIMAAVFIVGLYIILTALYYKEGEQL